LAVHGIEELGLHIDGIVCFWENDVVLCAEIAEKLDLPYNTVEAARICKSKLRTREAMNKAGLKAPAFHRVKSDADLEEAFKTVPFPAVLKPQYGAEAQGATRVNNRTEARAALVNVQKLLSVEYDSIYKHGCDCILEQYLDGDEVDVDLLLANGQVLFSSVTDNLETNQPDFINTGAMMPSILADWKQRELVELAKRTAVDAVGLTTGAVHIEMKYTSRHGPHIIEVNGRLCGNPLPEWIKEVWGVDFIEESYKIAVALQVRSMKPAVPLCGLAGTFLLNDPRFGRAVVSERDVQRMVELREDTRVWQMYWEVEAGYVIKGLPREEVGWLTTKGVNVFQAVEYLRSVCSTDVVPRYLTTKVAPLTHEQMLMAGPLAPPARAGHGLGSSRQSGSFGRLGSVGSPCRLEVVLRSPGRFAQVQQLQSTTLQSQ